MLIVRVVRVGWCQEVELWVRDLILTNLFFELGVLNLGLFAEVYEKTLKMSLVFSLPFLFLFDLQQDLILLLDAEELRLLSFDKTLWCSSIIARSHSTLILSSFRRSSAIARSHS